ncbi:MAG: IS4/Tn5 family transposase DNA-binding protein [Thermoguttaceae bacterium]
MLETWFKDELKTADFGDQRLNERFENILKVLSDSPILSPGINCMFSNVGKTEDNQFQTLKNSGT